MAAQKSPAAYSRGWIIVAVIIGCTFPLLQHLNEKAYSAIFATVIGAGIASLLTTLLGSWYIKRGKYNERALRILFWLNIVAWIIPFLGLFISFLSGYINARNNGADRNKYRLLGIIGLVLSLGHLLTRLTHLVSPPF